MVKGCELRGTLLNLLVLRPHLFGSGSSNKYNQTHCSCSSNLLFTSNAFDQHPKLLAPGVYDTGGAPRVWWLESHSPWRVPPVTGLYDSDLSLPVLAEAGQQNGLRLRVSITRAWCRPEHTAARSSSEQWAYPHRPDSIVRCFSSTSFQNKVCQLHPLPSFPKLLQKSQSPRSFSTPT